VRLIGTMTIPGRTESANRLESMSLRQRMAYKRQWREDAFKSALISFPAGYRFLKPTPISLKPPFPEEWVKRKVVITGYRKRLCDRQNFARGCKPVLDGLVDAGVLVDDSEKWLDDEYKQVQAGYLLNGKGERLEIEVWG
jgi:hypothetical protein